MPRMKVRFRFSRFDKANEENISANVMLQVEEKKKRLTLPIS